MELQRRFTRDGVETYSDLILGLPGETYDSFRRRRRQLLIETGQHNRIQFNNLSILPNAEMGDPAYQKKFGMVTVRIEDHQHPRSARRTRGRRSRIAGPRYRDAAMPAGDWLRTRATCWMVLLHFDKLFQILFIVANKEFGAPYREILEAS